MTIEQRIAAILEAHEYAFGHDTNCRCGQPGIWYWDDYRSHVAAVLVAELPSWDVLMACLDAAYPESIFPTRDDREDRDTGPRIISLLRQINQLRALQQEISEDTR